MESLEKVTRFLRFFHPEKRLEFLPGIKDTKTLAAIFGVPEDTYIALRNQFSDNVEKVADELLEETSFCESIDQLPLTKGSKIAVIGDSLTDDYQSWFEIIKRALTIRRPELNLQWFNTALSGDTTMQLFSTVTQIEKIKPDYLFCLIGTNDARIHGTSNKHCTGPLEVSDNLDAIARVSNANTSNQFIWITPAGVDEERIDEDWLLNAFDAKWDNKHIKETATYILNRPEPAIDIQNLFTESDKKEFFSIDGLHWSLEGQKRVAREVMNRFSEIISTKE